MNTYLGFVKQAILKPGLAAAKNGVTHVYPAAKRVSLLKASLGPTNPMSGGVGSLRRLAATGGAAVTGKERVIERVNRATNLRGGRLAKGALKGFSKAYDAANRLN